MAEDWKSNNSDYNISQEEVSKTNATRKLSKIDVDISLNNLSQNPDFQITKAVDTGVDSIADLITNTTAKNTIIPYAQFSRKHWVIIKVTKEENNKINIELIDSKGGASKRPEEEYSKNPIKRFGQKLIDKIGGFKDKILSTIAGNRELSAIKKALQKNNPEAKISTKLTKLATQRDDIHCGRHVIANIISLINGKSLETDIEKANINIKTVNDLIAGKSVEVDNKKANTNDLVSKKSSEVSIKKARSKSAPPSINEESPKINHEKSISKDTDNQHSKLAHELAEAAKRELMIAGKPIESQQEIYDNKMKSVEVKFRAAKSESAISNDSKTDISNSTQQEAITKVESVNDQLNKAQKETSKTQQEAKITNNKQNSPRFYNLRPELKRFIMATQENNLDRRQSNFSISPTPTPTPSPSRNTQSTVNRL